jgi:epoxide hydrolase-like predicted phosphatase
MAESNIRAVIWDLGGVLLRTEDPGPREQTARRFGMSVKELSMVIFDSETSARRFGMSVKELSMVIFDSETSRQAERGEISTEMHYAHIAGQLGIATKDIPDLFDGFFGGDQMDAELITFIQSLSPRYRVGMLSNAWGSLRQFLEDEHSDLLNCFDVAIISAEAGMRKPDDRIFQMALERLGVAANEAVFIDDLADNVAAARRNGLHAIQFQNKQQALDELDVLLST